MAGLSLKHDIASLLAHSDHALYESKTNGRNHCDRLIVRLFPGTIMQQDVIVFGEDWGKLPSVRNLIKHIAKDRTCGLGQLYWFAQTQVTWA